MSATERGAGRSVLDRVRRVPASTWVGLVIAVVAVVFVLQNQGTASVDLLWMTFRAPQWLTLLVVFVVGWLVGALVRRNRAR